MFCQGIVRKVDSMGRLTLPREMRRKFSLEEKDALEFFIEDDRIILRKYSPNYIFTGESNGDEIIFQGYRVSKNSIRELAKKANIKIKEL